MGRVTGAKELDASFRAHQGKPRLIILNHLSFMDALVAITLFSSSINGNMKSMASEHLFSMPILGAISSAAGHFRIPFKTLKTKKAADPEQGSIADMSVDKEGVAKSIAQFEQWVKDGNIGSWFPEGRLNPHPSELQT